MKKFFFFAVALMGLLAVSCNKEKEAPVTLDNSGKHLVSVKATIEPGTRTSYENDKTFSWVEGDVVKFLVLSADEQHIHFQEFTAQSSGRTTVFEAELEEGETLYGIGFYTPKDSFMSFGQDEEDGNVYMYFPTFIYIDGDNEKYYTVNSANPLENLPLTGIQAEDGSFVFRTAGGAAKFSFTDVPEGAAYFVIENSGNRLSGRFAMDENGVFTMEGALGGTYEYEGETYSNSFGYLGYHFDRKSDGTGSIYVPLPVGEIPSGATIGFYDEDLKELLYSRPLRADIPIERNKVTEVASFSAANQWEALGYGAYYDIATYYYMNSEVNNFTAVEVYKDAAMPGVYQISNPYPDGAEDRGYTIPEQFELPEYVSFTVLKDNSVVYDDIHTGYNEEENLEDGAGDWFLASPFFWGGENSFNFIAKYQEDGTPELMILSPFYLYLHNSGYYYALYSIGLGQDDWKQMFVELYFPGADLTNQYDLSCSVTFDEIADDNPMQATANVTVQLGTEDATASLVPAFQGAVLVVAPDRDTAREMVAAGKGTTVTESGTYEVAFPADAPNGIYYAYALTVPAEGFTENCALLFDSDSGYEYFRSDEDRGLTVDDIVGNYSATGDYVAVVDNKGVWAYDAPMTMVIEENPDPLSDYPITFTDIFPEVAAALAGEGAMIMAQPLDGILDTAHGVVTIPAGQVAYRIRSKDGNRVLTLSANYLDQDIEFFLREPGVLEVSDWFYLVENGSAVAAVAPDDDEPIVYTREGTSYTPARAKQHHPHFLPFKTPLEEKLGLFPELRMSKAKPRGERVPFPNLPNKMR